MFETFKAGLIKSGNAVKLETPILVNSDGEVVEDEADAYGREVTLQYVRPDNVFVADETGSSTREMGDGNNGGQKCMAPVGETPRYEASSKHSHFTVVPFTRLSGELVMVAIIFTGEKMKPEWALGKDVLADWIGDDDDFEANIGPGKYFPMGPTCVVDGKEIPCYCDCSRNGSMTSGILKRILEKLDQLGVTKRGVDEDGKPYYPALIVDGHISRMGLPFLKYINDAAHRWCGMLVCPYGTSKTQFHDHEIQNGSFKCALYKVKRERVMRHREAGIPADLYVEEVVIIVKEASDATYGNVEFAQKTFRLMGYLPFSRAVMDDPDILSSAPAQVQQERGQILKLRRERQGEPANSRRVRVAPNQVDLTSVGSGRMVAGGATAVAEAASALNTSSGTAGSILTLLHRSQAARDARRERNSSQENTREKILERYQKAKSFTAGVVFHSGNGQLDSDVLGEVQRRYDDRRLNASKIETKRKKKLIELRRQVELIRRKLKGKITIKSGKKKGQTRNFVLTDLHAPEVKLLCRWKKQSNEPALPTKKADLIRRWKKSKDNPSPHVSPCTSEAEDCDGNGGDGNDDDDVASLDSDATPPENDDLEFGGSDSEDDGGGDESDEEPEFDDQGDEGESDDDD